MSRDSLVDVTFGDTGAKCQVLFEWLPKAFSIGQLKFHYFLLNILAVS